jgi:tyrosyl-DNA phosphodiesterase 2
MNKNSLITSDKIYYKLKWHEKADTKKSTITFLNLGKLKTISYHDWIPMEKGGEIPWHRIYKFHYQNEILWDRDERKINLDLLNKEDIFSNIEMLKYNNKKWTDSKKDSDILPNDINIITFNCLMDIYDKHITDVKNRLPIICQYLEKYNADIICLQEITIKMKQYIMKQDFIQKNYYVTSNEPKIYGQMILTKYKPLSQNLVTLNGNHMKKYLHLLFKNNKDEKIEMYNIHLTSNDQINSEEKRDIQINQILTQVKNDKVILLGDFNSEFNIDDYNDIWEILKPNEDGFTFDYMENELTNKVTRKFNRTRIDKILFKEIKPISIELVFNEPINKIYASDHFGLLSQISVIDVYENNNENIEKYNKYTLKPGNVLCFILEPKYWERLNETRKLYDDGYSKIPPHVTLFQRFVDINEWYSLKDNLILKENKIKFDKIEIFELTLKYVLVLISSEDYKINETRSKLENILNIKQNTKPHITLGEFDNIKKALTVKNNIEKTLLSESIEINLNNVCYMKKVNDQYIIYDNTCIHDKVNPIELICIITKNIIKDYEYKLVGSRAFGIIDTDYDVILIGNIEESIFNNKFYSFAKMTSYFKYVKMIESRMNSLNIVTYNDEEINLVYVKKENKINNIYVNDAIEHINIIKKLLNDKFNFFCKCYYCIRSWANIRQIYGSKYGYLNGISWLYLTLNVFLKFEFQNKKVFVEKFFDYYNNYDWNIPININNLKVEKNTYSDNILYISSLTIKSTNIVRNLTMNTWKIILYEFKIAHKIENLNYITKKKEFTNNYIKVIINDQFIFNRIDKKNKISSDIWKLTIKNNIVPYIQWIDNDNSFIYYIGINDISHNDNIINYFKKFNTLVEIKKNK